MHGNMRTSAPNYTNAFLVSAGVLCMMLLMAIWAIWGFLAALATGYATDRVITRRSSTRKL